ncbi:hypothetical protein ACN4EE_18765 [Geminocystis sp. CENA526]|uniref:hypothetical protein n=1 Tax=Geminocystis sp. CENA526 TaxID=1355871 RepID=UPI003D6E12C4
MLSKISRFVAIATLTTLTCVIAHPSSAQSVDSTPETPEMATVEAKPFNVSRLVNEAFATNSGTFFEDASMAGQLETIFGWRSTWQYGQPANNRAGWRRFPQGSFPENNITADALLLNAIIYDYFRQMKEDDPIIRTQDLPNPFNTSLKETMDYRQ